MEASSSSSSTATVASTTAAATTTADEHSYSTSTADVDALSPREKRFYYLKIKCERVRHFLQHGRGPPGLSKGEIRNLRNQAKVHVLDRVNQALYYTGGKADVKKRVVIDGSEVNDIIKHYHSNQMGGHSGINGTLAKITQYYTWHGMKEDVAGYISACELCQSNEKVTSKTKQLQSKTAKLRVTQSLEVVGMDLIGPLPSSIDGCKFALTFTDYYSKFVDFYALKGKESSGIALCIQTFICRWGAPKRLLMNREPEFIAQLNIEVSKTLQISRSVVSSTNHPLTNSFGERTNQMLTAHLSKLINEHQDDWNHHLEELASTIRTQVQAATKSSPFFLMFGRQPRSPSEMAPAEELTRVPAVDESRIAEMVEMNTRVRADLERSRQDAEYSDDFRSQWTGTCLDSAFQILQTTAEFESLKYRTESTEDNEYVVITRIGTFASVGLPADIASITLDRHGKLTFQAAYQQAVEHRLFDGEAFNVGMFCSLLRKLVKMRFCKGIPENHITDADAHCVKMLGYPVLRYQAEKCQIFYELNKEETGRTPYRCVSCKYASKFLLKKNKVSKHPTPSRKELKRPLPPSNFYSSPEVASRGDREWIDRAKEKCHQPNERVHVGNIRPQGGSLGSDCHDLREIVQAINSECNVDLSDVVFSASSSVNNM